MRYLFKVYLVIKTSMFNALLRIHNAVDINVFHKWFGTSMIINQLTISQSELHRQKICKKQKQGDHDDAREITAV